MSALFAEVEPGMGQHVVKELAARGIEFTRGYPTISGFLESQGLNGSIGGLALNDLRSKLHEVTESTQDFSEAR